MIGKCKFTTCCSAWGMLKASCINSLLSRLLFFSCVVICKKKKKKKKRNLYSNKMPTITPGPAFRSIPSCPARWLGWIVRSCYESKRKQHSQRNIQSVCCMFMAKKSTAQERERERERENEKKRKGTVKWECIKRRKGQKESVAKRCKITDIFISKVRTNILSGLPGHVISQPPTPSSFWVPGMNHAM